MYATISPLHYESVAILLEAACPARMNFENCLVPRMALRPAEILSDTGTEYSGARCAGLMTK